MKLSLNWIKDYVNIPDSMDLSKFAYELTMSTVEVEGAHDIKKSFENIVVGEILEVNPHPNADKLRVCRVDTGQGLQRLQERWLDRGHAGRNASPERSPFGRT